MKVTVNLPDHAAAVEALLEGFVRACQVIVEAGLAPLDPTQANVRYQLEPPGEEDWKLPQNVIRDGWGDCEDLAGWRAAGLRITGEDPDARAVVARTGPGKLHCVVMRSDGSIDDPSRDVARGKQLGAARLFDRTVARVENRRSGGSGGSSRSSADRGRTIARGQSSDTGPPKDDGGGGRSSGKTYEGTRTALPGATRDPNDPNSPLNDPTNPQSAYFDQAAADAAAAAQQQQMYQQQLMQYSYGGGQYGGGFGPVGPYGMPYIPQQRGAEGSYFEGLADTLWDPGDPDGEEQDT